MSNAHPAGFASQRAAGVMAILMTTALISARPASGQTSGEAHMVAVRGGDSVLQFGGLAGGGGMLFRHHVGVDGEFALIGDDSPERVLAPALSVGGSLHFPTRKTVQTLVPFVDGGFIRFGDWGGWYAGGGAHYWLRRRMAIRVELRGAAPTVAYATCPNSRNQCAASPNVWFVRFGLTFVVAK